MGRIDPRVRRTHDNVIRTAVELLMAHGWDHVTHANVALASGYAKATLYKHWPQPNDLLRAAFLTVSGVEHHGEVTGDLRTDLVAELEAFRRVLVDDNVAKAMIALVDRAGSDADLASLRHQFLHGGQGPTRALLTDGIAAHLLRADLPVQPAADMLSGALTWRVACLGDAVGPDYVEALVDTFLRGAGR
jgi:AcrR family transcriptional regulator